MLAKRTNGWVVLLFMFISIMLTWVISSQTEAQTELNEVLPERLEMLVYPPTAENSADLTAVLSQNRQAEMTTNAPNFHLPGTLLVYQNFDTGNWEIRLNNATQSKINLTNHPAADIHPRLNRGATHIIFASNRAGYFDLYRMKVDGSQLTRLTATTGDNVNPVWSPDGSKIAFESYRDRQAEIYVMNADGSNQTRLTSSPDFDGMPTWSPDGQSIAFSSRRTGGYRIYTMDAATGANQTQQSTLPLSLSPAWSPDGKYIHFSATRQLVGGAWLDIYQLIQRDDGTTFQESGTAITNHSFSLTSDLWIRGWTPTLYPRMVFDVRYYTDTPPIYQLERTEIWTSLAYGSNLHPFNTNDFLSINPDVHTSDVTPPIVVMRPLPVLPASAATVPHWSYIETGAGVGLTQFGHKLGNGEWINWYDKFPGHINSARFREPVEVGQTVYFRAQSVDYNRNQGEWSEPSSTTFYNWYLTGQVRDNRGQAMEGVPVTFSKATLDEVATDTHGRYEAQTGESGEYLLSVTHEGNNLLPSTPLDRETRSHLPYVYLAPLNNVLNDGHFEEDLNQWQAVAGQAEMRAGFTGQAAVSLGETFEGCTNCVENLHTFSWHDDFYEARNGTLLADEIGNIHLLFAGRPMVHNPYKLYHTILNPEGVWSSVQPTPIEIFAQDLIGTADKQGNLHITYTDYDEGSYDGITKYVQYNKTTGWSDVEVVSSPNFNMTISHLFVDNYGGIHAIDTHLEYYFRRAANGTWAEQTVPANWQSYGIGITQLENGDIHLFQSLRGEDFGDEVILGPYNKTGQFVYQANGTWRKIGEFVLKESITHNSVQAAFVPEEQMWYVGGNRYQQSEGWVGFSALYQPKPELVHVNRSGNTVSVRGREPYQYQSETFFSEDAPDWVSGVLLDEDQMLHYVTSDMQYYGRHGRVALHDQPHTLAQAVTIPADMPNPTVSLMYRTIRDIPSDETQFEVQLTNGISTTTQALPPTAVTWEHAWFDASEWAGETVTLTLTAVQKAGDPLIRVDVDDVSLGSAVPDTWVTLYAPQTALPSQELTLSLNYGNFSPDLLAPTATLTLTLPADLIVNSVSMTPTMQTAEQIVWQLEELPANSSEAITLTVTVDADASVMDSITAVAELRTPFTELSRANNSYRWPLFIGQRAYLPIVQ